MEKVCAGCSESIPDRRFLTCSKCSDKYDLFCANVSEKRFYNTMRDEHKKSWLCPRCKSNQPKVNNTNTPIRQLLLNSNAMLEPGNQNITMRKKSKSNLNNESLVSNDSPPRGDTILEDQEELRSSTDELVLQELRALRIQVSEQYHSQEARIHELSETMKKFKLL